MKRQQDWNDVFLLLSLIRDYEKETGPTVVWLLKIRILLCGFPPKICLFSTLTESRNKMRGDKVCMPNLTAFLYYKRKKMICLFYYALQAMLCFYVHKLHSNRTFLKKNSKQRFFTLFITYITLLILLQCLKLFFRFLKNKFSMYI